MPDQYLDGLDPDERIDMWRDRIARSGLPPVLVAEVDGVVVGFAAFGAERSDDDTPTGELYAMNVDPASWGRGAGRALLRAATAALSGLGYSDAVLWVVRENERARSLYESEGWGADGGVVTEEVLGATVTDVRYRRALLTETGD